MKKCEAEYLDRNQVKEVIDAMQIIVDAFRKIIIEPDDGEFAVYDPHKGFMAVKEAVVEKMFLEEFKKPAFVIVDNSNLAFLFDDYNSFVIGTEDYIYSPIIWGKMIGDEFVGLAEEDFSEVGSQMFLRQSNASIDNEEFFLYRFIGGDEVCVDQSR